MTRSRDSNLDLLRATAITAVLVYHLVRMWPTDYPAIKNLAGLGKYGVTLFFVLSGWLIGGIYWREQASTGRVNVLGFWVRRWFRTVPPYLLGMALGFAAVYLVRSEPFDFRYFLFLQNYDKEMPFYLISWSLCVEEHFYLLLPILGFAVARMSKPAAGVFLWSLPLSAPILRLIDPNVVVESAFGYSHTATHLVSEGLTLGVAAAFTRRFFPEQWHRVQRVARYLALPAVLVFLSIAWWDRGVEFYLGQSVVALACFVWLAATAGRSPVPCASSKPIYAVAIASYSIYLTHGLAIHIARRLAIPNGSLVSETVCLLLWIAIIGAIGAAFYFCVERTSIRLRDYVSRIALAGVDRSESRAPIRPMKRRSKAGHIGVPHLSSSPDGG